jgi:BMFP domain-containing protein YqiC
MVKHFANQFNITLNLENIDKQSKKKSAEAGSLKEKIQQALVRMDMLLKENFELKREIVFERKKYVDLQQNYYDLKNNFDQHSVRASTSSEKNQVMPVAATVRQSDILGRSSAKNSHFDQRSTNPSGYWQLEKN